MLGRVGLQGGPTFLVLPLQERESHRRAVMNPRGQHFLSPPPKVLA